MAKDQNEKDITKEGQSNTHLYKKAAVGSVWIFSLRIIQVTLAFIEVIILAHLLQPSDFGLMGIALLTMSVVETFSEIGFSQALIQKKRDIRTYLDAAWTMSVIRGLVICLILFLVAPLIARFFHSPAATQLIQVIGLSEVFFGLTNVGVVYFQKELEFNKHLYLEVSGYLVDFIVSVVMAFILRSAWALVYGLIAHRVAVCIMSYILHPYKPRLSLHVENVKDLWSFGKWLMGSNILVFLITQGDDIVVGRMLGTKMLGYYQMAYKVSNTPATEVSHVLLRVTFPTYSKLQDDLTRLRNAFYRVYALTAYASIFIAGVIVVIAYEFTEVFLGQKWMPIVPALTILAFWAIVRSLVGTVSPVFMAIGKPKVVTRYQFFQVILMYALLIPFIQFWDIAGASLAVLTGAFIMFFFRNNELIKTIKLDTKRFYGCIVQPGIIAIISGALAVLVKGIFPKKSTEIRLVVACLVFVIVFFVLTFIYNRYCYSRFKIGDRMSLRDIRGYFKFGRNS